MGYIDHPALAGISGDEWGGLFVLLCIATGIALRARAWWTCAALAGLTGAAFPVLLFKTTTLLG